MKLGLAACAATGALVLSGCGGATRTPSRALISPTPKELPAAQVGGVEYSRQLVFALNAVTVQERYIKQPVKWMVLRRSIVCTNGSALGVAQHMTDTITWCTNEAGSYRPIDAMVSSFPTLEQQLADGHEMKVVADHLDAFAHMINRVGGTDPCVSGWLLYKLVANKFLTTDQAQFVMLTYERQSRRLVLDGFRRAGKRTSCSV